MRLSFHRARDPPTGASPYLAPSAPFARLALASPARQSSLEHGQEDTTVPRYLVTAHQRIHYGNQSCEIEVEAESEGAAKQEARRRYSAGMLFFDVGDVQDVSEPDYDIKFAEEKEPTQ